MAHVLIMPRQGNTVESCVIVRWMLAEGAAVSADTAVCEVETDKASFELSAGASGFLLKILRPEGDDVPVLEPIAVVGEKGEDWSAALGGAGGGPSGSPSGGPSGGPSGPAAAPAGTVAANAAAEPGAAAFPGAAASPGAAAPAGAVAANLAAAAPGAAPQGAAAVSQGAVGVSPRARALAAMEGLAAADLAGTGPGGRVIERDVVAAIAARPPLTAAARAALAAGAPAAGLPATGMALGGRAGLADLAAAEARGAAEGAATVARGTAEGAATAARGAALDYPGPIAEKALKGVRKIISERMLASLSGTAQLTLNSSAQAAKLLELRARFKASEASLGLSEVTIGDLIFYAVSRVLPKFPSANALLEEGILKAYERIHLALAVDTPRGLMVPVVRNADLLSLREISAEIKRLAAACQSGSISPDELSGGTFTVTNLGSFGIESFTPILNAPQVAILGVNAIVQRPVAGADGAIALEPRLGLSLTIDHQAVDGAPGARFLKAIADAIADIDLLLMR